ncbi:MAG: hypothetical protein QM692_23700 [Thermomicrobiales bacterium]
MVSRFVGDLTAGMPLPRLTDYRTGDESELDMLTNFLWNIQLCTALNPSLQGLEIGLRNSIHRAATLQYGTARWFDEPGVLLPLQREMIRAAQDDIIAWRKLTDAHALTADDVLPAPTLGFWASLLNRPYELPNPDMPQRLCWHDARGNPTALFKEAFPHAPRAFQSRRRIWATLAPLVRLRNRVRRNERISQCPDLPAYHRDILRLTGFVNPELRAMIVLCDDFPTTYFGGRAGIELRIRNYLNLL